MPAGAVYKKSLQKVWIQTQTRMSGPICIQAICPCNGSFFDNRSLRKESVDNKHYTKLSTMQLPAHNLCKQIEPRSGPTKLRKRFGSKPTDSLILFMEDFF